MDKRGAWRRVRVRGVVDTNVVAYYLLRTPPFAEGLTAFFQRSTDLLAPDLWRAELLNVLWMASRSGKVGSETAGRLFLAAEQLISRTVSTAGLWRSALALSIEAEHSAYDTLFVSLALRERLPLYTYDKALLVRFPDVAARPTDEA